MKKNIESLKKLAKLVRYYILSSTTEAGSGHPSSSLSSVELMTSLMFGGIFRYDIDNPKNPNNDRLIFSKGHAAPLFYSLFATAGKVTEKELLTLRKFGSRLEGHPCMQFPYTEAATGSLGQGLSVGFGMALNGKYLDKLPYKVFVLLGDGEMAEGSIFETMQIAAHYQANNLIAILDANRLEQNTKTMHGYNLKAYEQMALSFGWNPIIVDGHNIKQILRAYQKAIRSKKPTFIIAKTIKGKGVSFIEGKEGWHGKSLSREQFEKAVKEFGAIDKNLSGKILLPSKKKIQALKIGKVAPIFYKNEIIATRKAYGNALARIYPGYPEIVALDGDVKNSTYSEIFEKKYPKRFFEMFIAEQNMVGAAVGLSRMGKTPFVSTFAAFLTRAHDQIRMAQYSDANIKFVGSHAGVSIGQDGPSQMGLEDISMFRSLLDSTVLYPSDAVSTERMVELAAKTKGIFYIRTTRMDTPIIYTNNEEFIVGGSKTLKSSNSDQVTIVAAGITLHESLKAYEELKNKGINVRVIDLYSIKPLDKQTLLKAAKETKAIITVEDHFIEGGLGEAVCSALANEKTSCYSLAVGKKPKSGMPEELLDYEGISKNAIVRKIIDILSSGSLG